MKLFTLFVVANFAVQASYAADTTIVKKDGTTQVAKALRRQGDNIIATVELPAKPGDPVQTGDLGVPLAQIEKIEFPEPTVLKGASDLILQGRSADALVQIDAAFRFYEGFRDAPGSWWADLALLKMTTLLTLNRDQEAETLADTVHRQATDAEAQRAARTIQAGIAARRGNAQAAIPELEKVLTDATKPEVLAIAAVFKGQCLLTLKDWEGALLSFLQVPVLYPEQKGLTPATLLGTGRAHFGFDDFLKARASLNGLIKSYPKTPEATAAKSELELIVKRERALATPK